MKGLERVLGTLESQKQELMEATSGEAKYEHQHKVSMVVSCYCSKELRKATDPRLRGPASRPPLAAGASSRNLVPVALRTYIHVDGMERAARAARSNKQSESLVCTLHLSQGDCVARSPTAQARPGVLHQPRVRLQTPAHRLRSDAREVRQEFLRGVHAASVRNLPHRAAISLHTAAARRAARKV